MKLIEGEVQKSYMVEDICLPLQTRRRLESLGMTEGMQVEIINKKKRGAVIIRMRGTRFAIGRQIASQIQVKGEA